MTTTGIARGQIPSSPSEQLAARIDEARSSQAYAAYRAVRDRVLAMKDRDAARAGLATSPSEYWTEELRNFEYLLDASPLIVEQLCRHTFHVTGIRVYEYRSHRDRYRQQIEGKLRALMEVAGSRDLWVPEPRALGAFGFEIDGDLVNLDTLKYFEVLLAMERAALLGDFRDSGERRVAWEIGAGWGGFPLRFKTICPNTTYVITDFPELYLYSATYLKTMFPDARVRFYGDVPDEELFNGWEELDFVFLPHTRLDLVTPPRLDLAINMVSFQEMSSANVEAYIRHAFQRGCPYVYSLNRERSLYNPELIGVRRILDRYYWPHDVEVLPVSYVNLSRSGSLDRARRAKARAQALATGKPVEDDNDYRHVIGWRRAGE